MFTLIATLLVISGCAISISVLILIQRLFNRLPSKEMRSRKYFLFIPFLFFIITILGYLLSFWNTQRNWLDLLMPGLLFATACSLWVLYKLALFPVIRFALKQGDITDPLLGICNRSHLERRLAEEIARAQRYSMPLSIFLLNIDQFKNASSTHDRRMADHILIHLSRLLLEYVRESDEVARYDNNAILVMAPNTSIHDTHLLAERVRQRVETQPLLHSEGEKIERIALRVSIGVATLQGSFDSLDKLLERTEIALQQAQQAGGNCVKVFESTPLGNT